jgi:hypothetical protein
MISEKIPNAKMERLWERAPKGVELLRPIIGIGVRYCIDHAGPLPCIGKRKISGSQRSLGSFGVEKKDTMFANYKVRNSQLSD